MSDASEEELLAESIRSRVTNRATNPDEYFELVNKFIACVREGEAAAETLVLWLGALQRCVSCLDRRAQELVDVILDIRWSMLSHDGLGAISEFIPTLVSACNLYGQRAIRCLLQQCGTVATELEQEKQDEIHVTALHTLETLIGRVAPAQATTFLKLVRRCMPHVSRPMAVQEAYFQNILELAMKLPHLRSNVLDAIIDHLVKLDVSAREDEDEDGSDEDGDDGTQFEMDDTQTEAAPAASEVAAPPAKEETDRVKLDSLLLLAFEFVSVEMSKEEGDADSLFQGLLASLKRAILPTFQAKHVQFLVFYAASFNAEYAQRFVKSTLDFALDPSASTLLRQTAVAYVASFLARARFVSNGLVVSTLETMLHWIREYIDEQDETMIDTSAHLVFFAFTQAVMYIMCYRVRSFCEIQGGIDVIHSFGLDEIINSTFNPLKNCQDAICQQFARLMEAYQILQCSSLIKRNRGSSVGIPVVQRTDFHVERVEDFFPFDPFTLPKCAAFVKPLYRTWDECDLPPELAAAVASAGGPQAFAANGQPMAASVNDDDDFLPESITMMSINSADAMASPRLGHGSSSRSAAGFNDSPAFLAS